MGPRWNPVVGCRHNCVYCWARRQAKRQKRRCQQCGDFEPHFHRERLDKFFRKGLVFVCDMGDLFGEWVSLFWIKDVLNRVSTMSAEFLLLTKNPARYMSFLDAIPENCILGATIESDRNYPEISKAPTQFYRLYWMTEISKVMAIRREGGRKWNRLFIAIEPILDFNLNSFANVLGWINPWAVAVGYDNYKNRLPEPPLEKTKQLIERLEEKGITVHKKTLRKAWNEK